MSINKSILVILVTILLGFPIFSSHAGNTAVKEFNKIVKGIDRFFQRKPIIYNVEYYDESPTGRIVTGRRMKISELKYDVRKTDSLITPIVGIVTFNTVNEQHRGKYGDDGCGGSYRHLPTSINEAKKLFKKEICWEPYMIESCSVKIIYGYSEITWSISDITSEPGHCSSWIKYAKGIPDPESRPQPETDMNKEWLKW